MDAGALCLSSFEYDPFASRNPDESYVEKDRRKAPTLPHIRPLSLQNGSEGFERLRDLAVKIHQDGKDS